MSTIKKGDIFRSYIYYKVYYFCSIRRRTKDYQNNEIKVLNTDILVTDIFRK